MKCCSNYLPLFICVRSPWPVHFAQTDDFGNPDPGFIPTTDDTVVGIQDHFYKYRSNYLQLQISLDAMILHKAGALNYASAQTYATLANTLSSQTSLNLHPFPAPSYTEDIFATVIGSNLGLFLTIAFIYAVVTIASSIVEEKQIREGLKMMGLKHWVVILR